MSDKIVDLYWDGGALVTEDEEGKMSVYENAYLTGVSSNISEVSGDTIKITPMDFVVVDQIKEGRAPRREPQELHTPSHSCPYIEQENANANSQFYQSIARSAHSFPKDYGCLKLEGSTVDKDGVWHIKGTFVPALPVQWVEINFAICDGEDLSEEVIP